MATLQKIRVKGNILIGAKDGETQNTLTIGEQGQELYQIFSTEIMTVKRKWSKIFCIERRKAPTKNSIKNKIIIKNWKKNKDFLRQKWKEFVVCRLALQEILNYIGQ